MNNNNELLSLVTEGKDNEVLTTSKIVADNFGKKHKNVLQTIDNKINSAENSAQYKKMFFAGLYKDKSGKSNKVYYMNRDGFSFIAMGFTGAKADTFKLKFIDAFNKMEDYIKNKDKPSYMLEDKLERAKRWVQEQEYTLSLENTVKEQEPDVQFAKAVGNTKDLISVGDMANIVSKNGVSMGRTRLYQWMRDHHLVQQHSCKPTQYSINSGILKVQEVHSKDRYGRDHVNIVSRVTTKGQKYILQKFDIIGGEINLLND